MRDNPAQRLHDLLSDLQNAPTGESCKVAWCRIIGIPEPDTSVFLGAMADVASLPDQIKAALTATVADAEPPLFMDWYLKVQGVLSGHQSFNNTVQTIQAQYDGATLLALKFASNALSGMGRVVTPDQLSQLTTDIADLISILEASADLPAPLRALLLDLAGEMRRAVQTYRVNGTDGLEHVAAQCLGALAIRYPAGVPDSVQHTSGWQKFVKVTGELAVILGLAASGYQLGTSIIQGIAQ